MANVLPDWPQLQTPRAPRYLSLRNWLYGLLSTIHTRAALAAAESLAEEHVIEAEVIDVMSLSPLDSDTIIASVKRTRRLAIVHEAHAPCGIGAEIIARVSEQAHGALQAPPLRITPPFAPSPFAPVLEKAYLPDAARIAAEIRALIA